jgi:RNA polymerase sigma-70 factor (ECF subfamily)
MDKPDSPLSGSVPAGCSSTGGDNPSERATGAEWFASTHWSVVMAAKEGDANTASEALEKLCRTYWPPLYAFIRREGHSDAEAKDLTQEFFLRLVGREFLQRLRHQRGKFRSFLLTFLKHFLQEERGKARAQKRGGGRVIVSLDELTDHGSFRHEPVDGFSPVLVFELRWAQSIFQVALNRLREEYVDAGKGELFDLLKDFQPRETGAPSYTEIGARFGMTEAAVKSAVQRMRARHRQILREEIAHTVTQPAEIEEEIRHMRAVLSRGLE